IKIKEDQGNYTALKETTIEKKEKENNESPNERASGVTIVIIFIGEYDGLHFDFLD
ncbi:16975_t:CDS:2, partial [Cetraspora pellucida]